MKWMFIICLFALPVLAQDPVVTPVPTPVPSVPMFPYSHDMMVVLIVTGALGILSMLTRKIPGTAGKIVNWIVDVFSANISHK